jgi:glycosyltransferase involved in cell wall biosynthesis
VLNQLSIKPTEQAYKDSLLDSATVRSNNQPVQAPMPRMVVGITSAQSCMILTGRLRALRSAGLDVTLVASPGNLLTSTGKHEGVAVHSIAMERSSAPFADLIALISLLSFLRRVRPAITDFSTPKIGLLGNLAACILRVPHRVYTLRGLRMESSRGFKRILLLWTERIASLCAHVVLCNSHSLLEEARKMHIAPVSKLHLLGDGSSNGVDTAKFCPGPASTRKSLGIAEDATVIGFVGRLTRDKGIPELLTSFDQILGKHPKSWLLLVGWFDHSEDALSLEWRAHIGTHPRIIHIGYISDTAPYYRSMDMLILPTHREGFPNAVLEASASGVAVITTQTTGARDAVIPEVTGLLIPAGVPEAITEAALHLIHQPTTRQSMGHAGRRWATEHYSQQRVLSLATSFYLGLLQSKDNKNSI